MSLLRDWMFADFVDGRVNAEHTAEDVVDTERMSVVTDNNIQRNGQRRQSAD